MALQSEFCNAAQSIVLILGRRPFIAVDVKMMVAELRVKISKPH